MINTPWESRVWQLDMQLIGKVALSATAVFILALAYRFYKLRKLESTDPNGNHVPCSVTEKNPTEETPLRDYIGEENGNLRFRCVHNLQNSSVTDHVKAQEGLPIGDVTQKDQSGLTSEQVHKKLDPLRSQQQTRDDTAGQTDECDREDVINKTQSQDCRQDPEGGEMQEKSEMANGSTGKESEDLSASHENRPEENSPQVISTEIQGDIITDGGQTQILTTEGLREKMVESSSQPIIDEVDHRLDTGVHENQIPLTDLQSSANKGDISITAQQEPTNDDDRTKDNIQEEMSKIQNLKDNQEEEDKGTTNDTQTQGIESNIISSVTAPSSLSNQQDQDSARVVQSPPNTYHISLDKESTLDIHLDLGNCYEVLCLAKKYKHDVLIAAAYKIMSDNYLQVLQNPTIYGRLNAMERDLILEARMKGRRFVVVADIDTQANNAPENSSSLSYYDSDNDQWHALSHIPSEAVSRGSSMATLFNYIFIVLGSDGLERQMKPSKRVLCYNPSTDTWKEVASLKEARPHCKLVALDGCLYAIGGECLHTVEKYDPRQNKWSYIAPLPNDTFAVAHMATAYDDEIYVTGGTIRYMLLRYNHREKIWKNSHISGSKDRTTEIVIANNFLYRFDLNRSMGISVHRCNIRARIWYECATYAMPYPTPFQCVVIDNNIYCISRNFHLRFLADEVSPRFMDVDLQTVPLPKGILYPLVLVLPVKGVQ
ncbi:kelch domain-containing protein 7A [Bufo gargarizans]|uniref:kelch domain-containing protein 7A n=1 Tax=Bufo gargarizans TaxID=30331 RepID=UPI001CF12B2C|nr:kelch domain-containing protein 7A [Bufo gargarizans]